ncbi:MAG: hypothetical protein U0003_01595 [Vampirovibrionales bacterium]
MNKLLEGEALKKRATELGISPYEYRPFDGQRVLCSDDVLQERVIQAESHLRATRLFWFALISALASLASAIGSWILTIKSNCP